VNRSQRRRAIPGALLALLLFVGCGYRIVGLGGKLPGGVTRVEVPVFVNRTSRTDIGRVLTEAFIRQLQGAAKLRVVRSEEAEALIEGTVVTYKREPITFDSKETPLQNRLTIAMDLKLVSRADNRTLFSEKAVTIRYDYALQTDLQVNDRLEDDALVEASKLMSQKLVSLMLEGF
jgi:hypothetical protein